MYLEFLIIWFSLGGMTLFLWCTIYFWLLFWTNLNISGILNTLIWLRGNDIISLALSWFKSIYFGVYFEQIWMYPELSRIWFGSEGNEIIFLAHYLFLAFILNIFECIQKSQWFWFGLRWMILFFWHSVELNWFIIVFICEKFECIQNC